MIGPTPGLAIWAARIPPEKGLHMAIDAARSAGMDCEFAGPISHSEYYEAYVVPRLGDHVRYRGHLSQSELRTFYASGSVFVASPLWAELFGLTIVNAPASGTPVAAFPNGAMRELIAPGAGAVSTGTTVAALADAIRSAIVCDRLEVGRSSTRFSFDAMIDRYEEILENVAVTQLAPAQTGNSPIP